MLEFHPVGESSIAVFAYLYLQHLPREIRELLSEDDLADVRVIAEKAGRLVAMHVLQGHDSCAAFAADEYLEAPDFVAVTQGAWRKKVKNPWQLQQPKQKSQGPHIDLRWKGQDQAASLKTSMCSYYGRFGKQAHYCEEGCTWPGNYVAGALF
jgi:hypothetical protein